VSINHDQIDRDSDVYEEDIEDERVVEEEKEEVSPPVENEQDDDIIFVKEYKKILASTSRRTKINKEYFLSLSF